MAADDPTRPPLTRATIVAVARSIAATEGLSAVTLRGIARALGVTAPALYAHFGSKDQLLAAVAEEEFARLVQELAAATAGVEDPIERITAQSRAYVAAALANPALFEVMTVFRPAWVPQPAAAELPLASKAFELSAAHVQDAIDAGRIAETDVLLASLTLWAAVHGVATVLLARPGLGDDYEQALVESVIRSVVAGLARPDTSPSPEM